MKGCCFMIIVTGANGKLGRAVVEQLLKRVPAELIGVSVRIFIRHKSFRNVEFVSIWAISTMPRVCTTPLRGRRRFSSFRPAFWVRLVSSMVSGSIKQRLTRQ